MLRALPPSCEARRCGTVEAMPAADTWLLPLCALLSLLGLVFTGISWRRGRRGRVVQGVALTLAPVGLYLSGLLRLLWDGFGAVLEWVGTTAFSSLVWVGLGLLGLCAVLWLIGAVVVRRAPARSTKSVTKSAPAVSTGRTPTTRSTPTAAPAAKGKAKINQPVDEDMAEIEALLKSRGIE